MGFGAKPSPYSPKLAVSKCSQLSEGLGAKLWCVKGITILLIIAFSSFQRGNKHSLFSE